MNRSFRWWNSHCNGNSILNAGCIVLVLHCRVYPSVLLCNSFIFFKTQKQLNNKTFCKNFALYFIYWMLFTYISGLSYCKFLPEAGWKKNKKEAVLNIDILHVSQQNFTISFKKETDFTTNWTGNYVQEHRITML